MFDTAKRLFRAVFADQIRLRREGRSVRLELAPVGTPLESPMQLQRAREEAARRRELQAMQSELTQLLVGQPVLAKRSRHLVQLAHMFESQGPLMFKALPLPVMSRALAELEDAVTNWSPVGLATLRSKLAVTVSERTRLGEALAFPAAPAEAPKAEAADLRPGFEVTEVDLLRDPSATASTSHGLAPEHEALLAAYAATSGAPVETAS